MLSAEESRLLVKKLSDQEREGDGREHDNDWEDNCEHLRNIYCNNDCNDFPDAHADQEESREIHHEYTVLEVVFLDGRWNNVEESVECEPDNCDDVDDTSWDHFGENVQGWNQDKQDEFDQERHHIKPGQTLCTLGIALDSLHFFIYKQILYILI